MLKVSKKPNKQRLTQVGIDNKGWRGRCNFLNKKGDVKVETMC